METPCGVCQTRPKVGKDKAPEGAVNPCHNARLVKNKQDVVMFAKEIGHI
jgi:hypothetical protein